MINLISPAAAAAARATANPSAQLYGNASGGGLTRSRARTLTAPILDPREFQARYDGDKNLAGQLERDRAAFEALLVKKNATEDQVSRLVKEVAPHIAAMERQARAVVPSNPRDRARYDSAQKSVADSLAAQPMRTMEQLRERHGEGLDPLIARAQANTAEIARAAPIIGAALALSSAGNNPDVIEAIANIGS
jgi:hypothetical protein